MKVVRLRRGWRVNATDNEFEVMHRAVNLGLWELQRQRKSRRSPRIAADALPFKLRKVIYSQRWALPDGPLYIDEDRRPEDEREEPLHGRS